MSLFFLKISSAVGKAAAQLYILLSGVALESQWNKENQHTNLQTDCAKQSYLEHMGQRLTITHKILVRKENLFDHTVPHDKMFLG